MNHKRVPPYLSFSTFKSFLDGLRVSGVPTRIDRSIMASKSGATQVLLLSAMRYLGLASDNGVPTSELEKLVESQGKLRQDAWHSILRRAYSNVFKLDLKRATTQQIADIFSREGLSSEDTIRKALNFFCLAAKDAGIKLSPHIKPYAGRRQLTRKARSVATEKIESSSALFDNGQTNDSSEWQVLLSKFPSFDPGWPEDLRNNWFEGFERISKLCKSTSTRNDD